MGRTPIPALWGQITYCPLGHNSMLPSGYASGKSEAIHWIDPRSCRAGFVQWALNFLQPDVLYGPVRLDE